MTKFKKLFISVFLLSFLALVLCINTTKVSAKTYDDTNTSSWEATSESSQDIKGMSYTYALGQTVTSGVTSEQQINVLKMKTDGVSSKIVNWAIPSGNAGYRRAGLTEIAKSYEANHPGWIVVGGINADQYAQVFGAGGGNNAYLAGTPYYPLIIDGEVRFPYASSSGTAGNFVGFTNDGSTNSIVPESSVIGFVLYILDENNNEIVEYPISGINKAAAVNQTTVWSSVASNATSNQYISKTVNTTNNLFVVENADMSYMQTCAEYGDYDVIFAKGSISSTEKSYTLGKGQFAIETTEEAVINALSVGKKIKVQAKFASDAMNDVETAAGYHSCHIYNGVDQPLVHTGYDGKQYNRSIFGKTADGTYVLLTADKSNPSAKTKYQGLSFSEANAVLEYYGVTEAYQQDGGGSVTAIIRNELGNFEVVNDPSDNVSGAQRSIYNGLFFVVRDPGFTINKTDITRTTAKVTLKETNMFSQMKNVKVSINNQTYDMNEETLNITNLTESTKYDVIFNYEIPSQKDPTTYEKGTYKLTIQTKDFQKPNSGLFIKTIGKESIVIAKEDYTTASWIQEVTVHIGDYSFYMGNVSEFLAEDLIQDTEYDLYFSYTIVEPDTGNRYPVEETPIKVKTLAFELPTIVKLEVTEKAENYVKLAYEYTDPDDKVENAYIVYGNQKVELTRKKGTLKVENLDLTASDYTFQIQLLYYGTEGSTLLDEINSDEVVASKIEVEEPDPNPDPDPEPDPTPTPEPTPEKKKGCKKSSAEMIIATMSALSLLVLVIKKRK